jgi:hypothetical protein
MNLDALLGKLRGVRKSGSSWKAFCPAHDDKNPSLSIDVREQKILLFCHAGCSQEAVIAALRIEPSDLFLDANDDIERRIVAIYDYPDEQGKLLYQNVRYHPKDFRLRRPDGNGGWVWNLDGVRRVPFKLPEIIAADFILIPEGEKDANTSQEKLGFAATSSKHWRHDFCEFLRGKRVVIIADADDPGRKTAREVANSLLGKVPSLKLIELPGSAKDLTEWVAGGGTRDALEGYIELRPEWKPRPETQTREVNHWVAENMADFLADDGVEPEPLYERLLYPETITEVFSPRGLGKSIFALNVAITVARNGKRVLYIDRDNPRRIIRERMRALGADAELATLKVISREKCPPLTRSDAWTQFPYDDYDVVILDAFDSMAEGVGEQDSSKPSRAIAPILDIAHRENGPAVLVLGNCVKSAAHSRGSGIVEDRADIVFEVRDATDFHPTGSKWVEELPAQGASDWASRSSRRKLRQRFRLAFIATKFRLGEEPAPFILEVDTATEPWSVQNVTDAVDQEGAAARDHRARAKENALGAAIEALRLEIVRRERAGEDEILKMKAEAFLAGRGFKRNIARKAIASSIFTTVEVGGIGHPKIVRLTDKNPSDGGNKTVAETAKTLHESGADFRHPHKQGAAEINAEKHQCL